jgi:acyl-CoA thioesterase
MTVRAPAGPGEPVAVGIDPGWNSWTGLHGGYITALAAGAAAARVPGQALRSVQAVFLRPVTGRRAIIGVQAVRAGGTSSVLDADVTDDAGRAALRLRALLGSGAAGPRYDEQSAPAAPAPGDCPPFRFPVELVPFTQHLDVRPAGTARPLAGGDTAELLAWIRLQRRELTGPQALLVLADALPPALYATTTAPVPMPSADLAVHLGPDASQAEPDGWFLVRLATMTAGDGWSIDRATVWAAGGRLLASATQTRRILTGE